MALRIAYPMDIKTALFFVFSAILLFAAFRVITARSTVHSALFLVLSFFSAACVWMLLKAEFLAIALTLRRRKDVRYVNVSEQLKARKADRLRVLQMPAEGGALAAPTDPTKGQA